MKAAYYEQTGGPEVIRTATCPNRNRSPARCWSRSAQASLQSDRHLHSGRCGQHAVAQTVRARLRSGRHRRSRRADVQRLARSASGSGARTRGCSAGRAPLPNMRPFTKNGCIRPRPNVSDAEAAAVAHGRHHRAPRPVPLHQLKAGETAVRQRRHRRRRLMVVQMAQGGRRHGRSRQSAQRKRRRCARNGAPICVHQLQDRRRDRPG